MNENNESTFIRFAYNKKKIDASKRIRETN